jgi:hypothetical protein
MPSNLNALIRYKTIDRCLSNPYRKWSIDDLIEACSSALKEYRGIYTRISERTIREDLRILRSDILGFNAPIVQKEGNYAYEDPEYSIFKVSIQEAGLLKRVLEFMLEIRSEVKHPDMDKLIELISQVLPEISSVEEAGPEFDDLKKSARVQSMPAAESDLLDFGEDQEADAPETIRWSLILDLI